MNIKFKIIRNSVLAVIAVVAVNLIILYALGFPIMATEIIKKYFLLLVLLIGGFGFQVGLFTYISHKSIVSCGTTVASGTVSAGSMILCCSHYLVSVLPFIGISALASLSGYTLQFLIIGILSNAIGIGIMFHQNNKINKNQNKKDL